MPSSKPTKARNTTTKRQSKPATSVDGAPAAALSREDVQEQIRRRAYELFQQRNGHYGSPEEDWLRAESEIRSRTA
jgi:hypothetical protein